MDRIRSALFRAADAGIISLAHAHAIAACFFRHADSDVISMDMSPLTLDELDALDAVTVWLEADNA